MTQSYQTFLQKTQSSRKREDFSSPRGVGGQNSPKRRKKCKTLLLIPPKITADTLHFVKLRANKTQGRT